MQVGRVELTEGTRAAMDDGGISETWKRNGEMGTTDGSELIAILIGITALRCKNWRVASARCVWTALSFQRTRVAGVFCSVVVVLFVFIAQEGVQPGYNQDYHRYSKSAQECVRDWSILKSFFLFCWSRDRHRYIEVVHNIVVLIDPSPVFPGLRLRRRKVCFVLERTVQLCSSKKCVFWNGWCFCILLWS